MFCICAREASSGTTPPYCSCTAWLAMGLDNIFPSTQIAADVSSQEDSIARIVVDKVKCYLLYLNLKNYYSLKPCVIAPLRLSNTSNKKLLEVLRGFVTMDPPSAGQAQ